MLEKLQSFLLQIPELENQDAARLIDYFAYYLTTIEGKNEVCSREIEACFDLSKMAKYSNISAYLQRNSKRSKSKKQKFLKSAQGYQLERSFQVAIQQDLHVGPTKIETSYLLRSLIVKVATNHEKAFLQEAIDCYEIGARRAAIVMTWILSMNHLYHYVLKNQIVVFNASLSQCKDKRVKINLISKVEDFTEIPENIFIDLLRASKIISNDVRKILEVKLGIRNSSAHPSAVLITELKATEFIEDLVNNVILFYPIN